MDNDKPIVFSKQWFGKHQNKLLFLLNNKFTRFIFRKIMRIDSKKDIVLILPNSYTILGEKESEYVSDFRTHDKFAEQLYYVFKPIWHIIHTFDTLFANKWIPEWNLGFDTLTVYPDANSGGTTVDGLVEIGNQNKTFSEIIALSTGDYASATGLVAAMLYPYIYTSNRFQILTRGVMTFNTSSLTSSVIVSNAVLSLYGFDKTNNLGEDNLHICYFGGTNSISTSDFSNFLNTSFGNISYSSFSITGYNNITLNSSGISNISKTGVSKFGCRLGWDINGSFTGTWSDQSAATMMRSYSKDNDSNKAPKLVVTYTLASFIPQILFL